MSIDIMAALLGMAMLYTVIAMVNAVVISASERCREFAAARVTGLTRGQVIRVAVWESLAVVGIGLVLGGLAAAIVGVTTVLTTWTATRTPAIRLTAATE